VPSEFFGQTIQQWNEDGLGEEPERVEGIEWQRYIRQSGRFGFLDEAIESSDSKVAKNREARGDSGSQGSYHESLLQGHNCQNDSAGKNGGHRVLSWWKKKAKDATPITAFRCAFPYLHLKCYCLTDYPFICTLRFQLRC